MAIFEVDINAIPFAPRSGNHLDAAFSINRSYQIKLFPKGEK